MQTKGKAEHIRKLPEIVYDEVLSEQQTETEDSSTKGIHAGDVYQYFDFKALRAECSCHECYEARYYWSQKSNCGFIAAALDMAIDHLKEHSRLDATDKLAVKVIHNFAEKRRSQIISENRRQESSVVLEPRIVLKDEEIGLSFKVGDDKLFIR